MDTMGIYFYTLAVGFVAAGLVGSIYQLVTNRQIAFEVLFETREKRGVGRFGLGDGRTGRDHAATQSKAVWLKTDPATGLP